MEGPLTMQLHGAMIGAATYFLMTGAGQSSRLALSRSALIANASAAYMIMFGHGLPKF